MSLRHVLGISSTLAALVLAAAPALAHPGIGSTHGFTAGLLHPLGGLDHVLAMTAVGMLAAVVGGWALWLVPMSFVLAMIAGGTLAITGIIMPGVEAAIILSVVVLGGTIAASRRMPLAFAMTLAGAFAVFHGYAHGAEMPALSCASCYGLGFVSATAFLHGVGMVAAIAAGRLSPAAVRIGGGAIAATGLAFFLV